MLFPGGILPKNRPQMHPRTLSRCRLDRPNAPSRLGIGLGSARVPPGAKGTNGQKNGHFPGGNWLGQPEPKTPPAQGVPDVGRHPPVAQSTPRGLRKRDIHSAACLQVLEFLKYLHEERHVVHRDLKPAQTPASITSWMFWIVDPRTPLQRTFFQTRMDVNGRGGYQTVENAGLQNSQVQPAPHPKAPPLDVTAAVWLGQPGAVCF